MRAIVVREFGGPEVMKLEDVPEPAAGWVALAGILSAVSFVHRRTKLTAVVGCRKTRRR